MAGLLLTGLEKATEEEITSEIKSDLWDSISDKLNLASASPLGQIVGIFSQRLAILWDLAEAVHNGRRADSATGSALTALALITGTQRKAASKTTVTVVVNIDDGFSQAPGTMVANKDTDPTARFVNVNTVTNSSGVTADFSADFEAETAGALQILSGELTEISEPITGWNTVTNALDGAIGNNDEEDADLRIRREIELQQVGATTVDAIRSDILDNLGDNITHCTVHANDTNTEDVNNLPPHSIEVIARALDTGAAEAQRLADFIFRSKAAGIETYGTTTKTVTDDQGNDHVTKFSFTTNVSIWFEIDIVIDDTTFPLDGDDQIKNAIIAIDDDYEPGDDIIAERIKASAFTVTGLVDVSALRLGTSASPVGTANIAIGVRSVGVFDTSRIIVTHV